MSNSTRSASIYGLFDLSDPYRRVRYVGQTTRPLAVRHQKHLEQARRRASNPVYRDWMSDLDQHNLGMLLLEQCEPADRLAREQYWINALQTSVKQSGFNVDLETRTKAAGAAAWASEGYRERMIPLMRAQGPANGALGAHIRWHVNQGVVGRTCELC